MIVPFPCFIRETLYHGSEICFKYKIRCCIRDTGCVIQNMLGKEGLFLMTEPALNIVELGEYVKRKRQEEKLPLGQGGANISVSPSSLSRIENAVGVPGRATLARLAAWLGIPLERLMRGSLMETGEAAATAYVEPVIYYPTESMPSIVE